jgi:hypothetical protein
MSTILSFWKNASLRRKRIYSVIIMLSIAIVVTLAGTLVPLSAQQANAISKELNQTLAENKASGSLPQYIFLNNFEICLFMFIPIAGPLIGMFILFNTGTALSAIAQVQGFPAILEFAPLMITPIFWLEFISYSAAMTESIWLFRRLLQGRWQELKWTGVFIGFCALLLAIGAIVEAWLIMAAG